MQNHKAFLYFLPGTVFKSMSHFSDILPCKIDLPVFPKLPLPPLNSQRTGTSGVSPPYTMVLKLSRQQSGTITQLTWWFSICQDSLYLVALCPAS